MEADTRLGVPAGPLRGHVAYHGYDLRGALPGTHRGLPSPSLTLVVTFGEPLTMLDATGTPITRRSVLGGLHTVAETIVHRGRQSGVHVVLDPLAARALLGRPAAELHGVTADTDAVLGAAGRELAERVDAADGWDARFAALDTVLGRAMARAPRPTVADEVRHAWRRLVGSGGRTGVRDLADEVGWSDRHLGQRFRAELGVGPKAAARMARFDVARRRLAGRAAAGHPLALAELAADAGYADQAHLAREFRDFAGCSPTRWIAEEIVAGEIGNVQDALTPEDPGWAP